MPPASSPLCLLRLSALGDVTHVVPLVRTLQQARPGIELHWVIDKAGHRLLEGLPGVAFHVYDKKSGLAGMRARCEAFGGSFEAGAPASGRGTRVAARLAWDSLFAVPAAARHASRS